MEIQQWEKGSLAAYVYWSKTEAKRGNFTNDAGTIRIIIKGLKNVHNLATTSMKRNHLMFTDANLRSRGA